MAEEEKSEKCFFCQSEAQNVCSYCKSVSYCTQEHWKIHRPETLCFPFKVKFAPHVGRFMIATRNIKASGMLFYLNSLFFFSFTTFKISLLF
jgi:hypothetical protein